MKKRNAVVPLMLALAVVQAQAQDTPADPNEALNQILSKAMSITISARILPQDESIDEPIWSTESTKLTISGRPIRLRLDGDNLKIYLVCTPYLQENGEVLLLAQGEVWFTEPTDNENKYYSTFYTIPVSFGQPILFFPLGTDTPQKGYYNIEMEIKIVPLEQKQ